ncbi:MAG: hypothetical protein SYC29_12280 [Planctomycetota bacterium]|nr:hypothetical protein [Planctomycetota bacterium]
MQRNEKLQGAPRAGRRLRGLLALNAALLAVLGAVTFGPSAGAQARTRGDYTMAAGRANGAQSGVVYIVDTVNQELIAVTFDPNNKQVDGIGYRSLTADISSLTSGTRPR